MTMQQIDYDTLVDRIAGIIMAGENDRADLDEDIAVTVADHLTNGNLVDVYRLAHDRAAIATGEENALMNRTPHGIPLLWRGARAGLEADVRAALAPQLATIA